MLHAHQSKKGGFKDTRPEEILMEVLRAVYTKVSLDPALVEDVSVGNVLPPGGGAGAARMAALAAGIPNTTAVNTVNRQCSSGLTAVTQIANEIATGQIDIGIGTQLVSRTVFASVLTGSFSCMLSLIPDVEPPVSLDASQVPVWSP